MSDWDIYLSYGSVITVEAESTDDARRIYADAFGDYKSIERIEPRP